MAGYTALAHGFPENSKVMGLHDRAFRFYVTALDYCGRNLTDGHVSAQGVKIVAAIVNTQAKRWTVELVAAGLWRVDEDGDGFWINDYLIYNPSAAAMKDLSDKRRAAGVRGAEAKWRNERINKGMREILAERLGGSPGAVSQVTCHYCPTPITIDWSVSTRVRFLDGNGQSTPEIDHVEPLAKGGPHDIDNLVLACLRCNRVKGAHSLASASGNSQNKSQGKALIPAEQSRALGVLDQSSGRHFPEQDLPMSMNPENVLLVARLMQRIGDHADDGTHQIITGYADRLPPAAVAKVIESLELNHPRNRARYAVGALKREIEERAA